MMKKAFVASTALVLCASASFAGEQSRRPASANAQFLAWYGGAEHQPKPHDTSKLLYEQSASSGFSTYGISSWGVSGSAPCHSCFDPMAADDFTVPGTGKYKVTAVYVPGRILSGTEPTSFYITFYQELKYSKINLRTTVAIKATCTTTSYSDLGHGDFLVDLSSCNLGRFKNGHDYSLSVQPWFWSNGSWAWQTNSKQIGRQGFVDLFGGGGGSCNEQLTPIKICFPESGYGPDLAFAIYGRQL